jgi:hypothetical protein
MPPSFAKDDRRPFRGHGRRAVAGGRDNITAMLVELA